MPMNNNSLAAYEKVNLPKAERETIEWLAKYGPASQAVLIKSILAEPRFDEQEDAQRVKFGQNLYARLHGLKAKGIAVVTGTEPDPYTGNTVDVYALSPVPPAEAPASKKLTVKELLARITKLEERLDLYPTTSVLDVDAMKRMVHALKEQV